MAHQRSSPPSLPFVEWWNSPMSTDTQDLELGALLDSSPDPVSRFDRKLRHVYANRATAIANQRPVEDFYGRTMAELGHAPEVCDFIESHVQRVFIEGETLTAELLFEEIGRASCRERG